ncbi:MAG: pyruvate, phosphate dikinase [Desulfobacteraceae bacterium]|nr:pyruvate, phosphate dikinase [Desulfobacteraceae bacterium]
MEKELARIKSEALAANIASYHVDVAIDEKYVVLQAIMSRYFGLMEKFNTFLKELSHPYKNWKFIIQEARGYCLDYFHLFEAHPDGPGAIELFVDIFQKALKNEVDPLVRADGADALLLFLQKVLQDCGQDLVRFMPVVNRILKEISNEPEEDFSLFIKSFYPIPKNGDLILKYLPDTRMDLVSVNTLLIRYYRESFNYWFKQKNPGAWFNREAEIKGDAFKADLDKIFYSVSHEKLLADQEQLEAVVQGYPLGSEDLLRRLTRFPGYNQMVAYYRRIPQKLQDLGAKGGLGHQWKVLFLFNIMNVSGLSMAHEETLREINRTLRWLIRNESHHNTIKLIEKTFSILKAQTSAYPTTTLNCILNMGKGVYETEDIDLVKFFIDRIIDSGFQYPSIRGVGNDWQIQMNSAHIQNIRTWLELIKLNPKLSTRLISYLIIHISLSGVFIKDTDLFPRDITHLLNSNVEPVYNLIKQMTPLFPVFFNDIGAEGKLRDISTEIDEITHRKDVLIHFLRKQSHVESSNRITGFMESVIEFWSTRDKRGLAPYLPPGIYSQIETAGLFIDGVYKIFSHLVDQGLRMPEGLLSFSSEKVKALLEKGPPALSRDRKRALLLIELYKLLHQKYHLDYLEINHHIERLTVCAFPRLKRLKAAFAEADLRKKILALLAYLDFLKTLIVSEEEYEIKEDIYNKRHFTVDIPSMYGSYHELKFDALGLTFRIESYLNVLLEELINNIDLTLITKSTFYQIEDRIRVFHHALRVNGINSVEIEHQLDFLSHSLEVRGVTFTQYLDIFKGFTLAVKNIINDHFNNIHEQNLKHILDKIALEDILSKYLPTTPMADEEKLKHRISEVFFRDRITLSPGLQQLDVFLSRILNTLFYQSEKLPKDKLHLLLNYDPENALTSINNPGSRLKSIIHLGNKGLNLVKLKNFKLPVPPGFIITTEIFRCREIIDTYPPAEQNFREQITREIARLEEATKKSFGKPDNPLLFSVRSGSAISQPGMMDTFLDVGMNEDIAQGMATKTGNAWFAWDNYRRFLQCYGMSYDLERDGFDAIINEYKEKWGIPLKKDFSGDQMYRVALAYKKYIADHGIKIIENPLEQLYTIIQKVLDSWETDKARTYRKIMGISDDWGTAVTIQEMVYGNISQVSGSGVFFTHNPRWSEDNLRLWGDFTVGNQGEDVVSGLVNTLPISINQQNIEMRETDVTLETHFPEIYKSLMEWASLLVNTQGWSPQEIEFTFESPASNDLYALQTRDMVIRERKGSLVTFDFNRFEENQPLGHGIGVSGGAMAGRVVFTLEEIERWRKEEPGTALILIRGDTVPDDIREIFAADGLLTARGGLTSHAAVVAHRLDKTCVVGCGDMICNERDKKCIFGPVQVSSGDYISLDGQEGSVYGGLIRIKEA